MFTALKTVTREVAPSMGSNISLQRSALNQLDSTPANMLSITHSQRHPFRPSRNYCQLTSRKQNHSSTAASTSDKVYFNMFLIFFFINDGKITNFWDLIIMPHKEMLSLHQMFEKIYKHL